MVLSVLPVNSTPNQIFECTLPVDSQNRRFKFLFEWNPIGEYWQFDLFDLTTGEQKINKQVVDCINYPYNNIIRRFLYKEIGSLYVVSLTGNNKDRPGYEDLGNNFSLIWGDTPDVKAIS